MNSGQDEIKQVRWYKKFLGADYPNVLTQVYTGEGPEGPMIELVNMNPWAEKVPLNAGDGWFYYPNLGKDAVLPVYFDPAATLGYSIYNKTVTVRGMECYRYVVPPSFTYNATQNPAHAVFYQLGPQGLLNQTSILQGPLFISKPYFLDADPMLNQLITYTTPQYNFPDNYNTYSDVEYYSGIPIYLIQQLQFNVELKGDALFPNLGRQNYDQFGYNTYMPMLFTQRSGYLSADESDNLFGPLNIALTLSTVAFVSGIVIGVLIFLGLGCYFLRKRIVANRLKNQSIKGEQKQLLLLA